MCARCPGGAYGLSKARAEAIKSFVAKCGVDVDRVYAVGFAGTRRLSDDITEEKGAVNRRVEVHMMLCKALRALARVGLKSPLRILEGF